MDYPEQKIDINGYKYKYTNEDLYGSCVIFSKDKLSGVELDEIVCDNIIPKGERMGHDKNGRFVFEAKFKNPWEEIKEDEKYLDISELPLNQQECCKEKEGELNKELNKVNYYKLTLVILTIISFFVIMTLVL